jgi:GR25 family glycosyltransferase involved in LPS biosynthesis
MSNNEISQRLAQRCADSCNNVGQPFFFWEAYDGISNPIVPPDHHSDIMKMIKIMDHYMTRGEVATALSHISLWARCVVLDQPIVILEHDAIMLKAYSNHRVYNSICYLGGREQVKGGWKVTSIPPHASEGRNYHFICRAHAYAIDPGVAKSLLAYVIKYGITAPLDIMIRSDIFPIHQMGLYAYDEDDETTILGRPKEGRTTVKNENLDN